ncbi:hemerythrin domain-containing protein [Actinoplanes sp. NPDC024001]|uniref:hemerythrin domain-containing protein n=1 Tax=Actinoplanes sp. NPDC024001 TaxID=3154598 RepID=UPI0033E04E9F
MTTIDTTEPVDTWEMVLVHRVFRREFRLLPGLVRAVAPGDTARAGAIADHLSNLAGALHHHHTAEDELLWPQLLNRAGMHADLIHRMEAQHDRLHEPLARIGELNPRWRATAAAADRDELAEVIAQASVALDEHLADEEAEILPLVSRYLTHAEWDALGKRGQESIPKNKLALVFLGSIFEEATPEEKKRFLAQLPPPIRLVWRLFGDRVYRKARDRVRVG